MPTSFQVPINRFFQRIEEDREFFQYFNLGDMEAMQLAQRRAMHYLRDATDRFILDGMPEIDLTDTDEIAAQFNEDLTSREIFILASLMYEYYMKKDIAKLKTYQVNYTDVSLRVFDPSNARTTFQNLYQTIVAENEALLDTYRNTDRITGAYKSINYASFDEEDS